MQQQDYTTVVARYQQKRALCHAFATEALGIPGLNLRPIFRCDAVLGDSWRAQWSDAKKRPNWDWAEMFDRYNSKQGVKRFEVAVWLSGTLCALCYGVPTRNKLILQIHALGRAPSNNPLAGKTIDIILTCATFYARLLGSTEIWICEPMNTRLVNLYTSHGFSPVPANGINVTHLIRGLSP